MPFLSQIVLGSGTPKAEQGTDICSPAVISTFLGSTIHSGGTVKREKEIMKSKFFHLIFKLIFNHIKK